MKQCPGLRLALLSHTVNGWILDGRSLAADFCTGIANALEPGEGVLRRWILQRLALLLHLPE